jgi:hypothetical protein
MVRGLSDKTFTMAPPRAYGRGVDFAFWLRASDHKLLALVRSMNCVNNLKRHRPTGRILVEINDDHDPDEAWHWIRTELEEAVNYVELDDIWEEALRWIL